MPKTKDELVLVLDPASTAHGRIFKPENPIINGNKFELSEDRWVELGRPDRITVTMTPITS